LGAEEAPQRERIESIDVVRGLVMVLMLLDHTRDAVHGDALRFDPLDLSRTTVPLFLTRWITHFCAPAFVFLAGTSARIQSLRGLPLARLSRFLWTRGLFLVALELLVIRPLIWFNLDPRMVALLQVIWAIGWSMVGLAALVRWMPAKRIGALGLAILLLHNLLDRFEGPEPSHPLWVLLHRKAWLPLGDERFVLAAYPLVPWFGVMAAGYAFGSIYASDPRRRRRRIALLGAAAVSLFVGLRALDVYGDPNPWRIRPTWTSTALDFVDTEKYPPSLLFAAMTLGPMLLALAWLDGMRLGAWVKPLLVFGRVPLFFYLLQWPATHLIARAFQWADGQPVGSESSFDFEFFTGLPEGLGFSLSTVYVAWAILLVALHPLCAWYARLKRRHRDRAWTSYL
jgi:uncharacterized membrane protein